MHGVIPTGHAIPASFQLGRAWFVGYVEPSAMIWNEDDGRFSIEKTITENGFETFAPAQEKMGMRRGRKIRIISSVFGSYVFIRFDRDLDNWGNLCAYDYKYGYGIKGFIDILKNNNAPIRVPDIVVSRLQQAVAMGVFGLQPLAIDTEVEITEGQFAGMIGKIKSATKKRRVKVLLKMLATVDIDPCFLRKI
jgi:transcription antitermination factor NusG